MDRGEVLRRVFGYEGFRPGQETLIDGVLSGRDVFGIMPTGGGKSVCYQIPALMLPGVTLVISPLISLMRDQVMALKAAGVPAAYINSSLTGQQMQLVYRNLLEGKYKIVYLAPERLDYPGFGSVAAQLRISFLAVDEAHCISQWGQDFRPSYLRIVSFIQSLPRRPVVGAFTATATNQVREDVERLLGLRDPVRVVTGFDRPNLCFSVVHPERKDRALKELLLERRDKSGIVYCATRRAVESVCQLLCTMGYAATRYHAGLEEGERTANQEDFLYDRKNIMVATNAFGMGIDKSNVSFVIHYNMPKSMEAYYQEAGRAGRDGAPADCILLYNVSDVRTAQFFINSDTENDELDPKQRELVRQQDIRRLDAMVGYCKATSCLRGYILEYFGQVHPEVCGNCGNCREGLETVDITRESQMILSCIKRVRDKLGYPVGFSLVSKVLRGRPDKAVREKGLESLSTFGLMKDTGMSRLRSMANALEGQGYLKTEMEHQTVSLTEKAGEVLYRGQTVTMLMEKEEARRPAGNVATLAGSDGELFDILKELRLEVAKESRVPAYVVFSNATLMDMATRKPRTSWEFKQVSGVGELKARWYADRFLKRIRKYLEEGE